MSTTQSLRQRFVASAPGKVILFGEHAVVLGKTAIATALGLRTYVLFEESENSQSNAVHLELPDLSVERKWTTEQLDPFYSSTPIPPSNLAHNLHIQSNGVNLDDFMKSLENLTGESNSSSTTARGLTAFLYLYFSMNKLRNSSEPKTYENVVISLKYTSHHSYFQGVFTYVFDLVFLLEWGLVLLLHLAFLSLLDYWNCILPFDTSYKMLLREKEKAKLNHTCVRSNTLAYSLWYKIRACSSSCAACNSYNPCKVQREFINNWAFQAEKIMHGTPSGIDNSVSTFGGTLTLTRTASEPIQHLDRTPSLDFLLTNTKVPRNTKALVTKVGEFHRDHPDQSNPILDEIHGISLQCIKQFENHQTISREELCKTLGELMSRNHILLCQLGVGHESLDRVCTVTASFGLHSKLTGAGGGGCALTLINSNTSPQVALEAKNALEKEGFECFQAEVGGAGVLLHRAEQVEYFK